MTIDLVLNTSSQTASCTIGKISADDKPIVLAHTSLTLASCSSELMQLVDDTLLNCGAELAEIDRFAVVTGPGRWSGIRIGVTLINALGWANSKPVAGICKFGALAIDQAITSVSTAVKVNPHPIRVMMKAKQQLSLMEEQPIKQSGKPQTNLSDASHIHEVTVDNLTEPQPDSSIIWVITPARADSVTLASYEVRQIHNQQHTRIELACEQPLCTVDVPHESEASGAELLDLIVNDPRCEPQRYPTKFVNDRTIVWAADEPLPKWLSEEKPTVWQGELSPDQLMAASSCYFNYQESLAQINDNVPPPVVPTYGMEFLTGSQPRTPLDQVSTNAHKSPI